jgi:chromosome segregation ATPase
MSRFQPSLPRKSSQKSEYKEFSSSSDNENIRFYNKKSLNISDDDTPFSNIKMKLNLKSDNNDDSKTYYHSKDSSSFHVKASNIDNSSFYHQNPIQVKSSFHKSKDKRKTIERDFENSYSEINQLKNELNKQQSKTQQNQKEIDKHNQKINSLNQQLQEKSKKVKTLKQQIQQNEMCCHKEINESNETILQQNKKILELTKINKSLSQIKLQQENEEIFNDFQKTDFPIENSKTYQELLDLNNHLQQENQDFQFQIKFVKKELSSKSSTVEKSTNKLLETEQQLK